MLLEAASSFDSVSTFSGLKGFGGLSTSSVLSI
jgi:hypothetical protein